MVKYVGLGLAAILVLAFFACSEEEILNGTIAGNVKDDGANVSGAFVLLLDEGQMVNGQTPLSNGSVTLNNGNYTIINVTAEKNFYVVAIKDEDGNGNYTPGVDPVGYYGTYNSTTGVWIPKPVSITSGQNLAGINVADLVVLPAQ